MRNHRSVKRSLPKSFSRREFLRLAGVATGGLLLSACAATLPDATEAPTEVPLAEVAPSTPAPATESTPGNSDGPRRGGRLRWGFERAPNGFFDPALATAMPMTFNKWTYEGLVHIDQDFAELIPRLAVSWQPEEGGKAWVFDLRQGVRFHHGREFVAEDVVHTFERILDPEFGSPGRPVFSNIVEIETPDEHTVRFRLDAPNSDFPVNLTNQQALIVPHDLTDEEINGAPRGTGPFTIDRYMNADRISFERNDEYWDEGVPYIDGLDAICIPEATTLSNALQAGEVHVVHILSAVHAPMLEKAEGVHLAFSPAVYKEYIYMRLDREPFTDDRVRRAFKLIPDRNAMRELVWGELPARTNDDNPVIPTSPVHAETDIWHQDLEEARRLLEEAGYGDGLELDLWAINDQYGIMEFSLAFADWAAQAGVTINIQGVPSDRFYAEKWLDVPLGTVSWSARTTADEQLRIAYASDAPWNETAYQSAEFDDMLDEALQEIDSDRRKELYEAIQRKLITEGGQIIHCHSPLISGVRDSVHNYIFHPLGDLEPRYVWLS